MDTKKSDDISKVSGAETSTKSFSATQSSNLTFAASEMALQSPTDINDQSNPDIEKADKLWVRLHSSIFDVNVAVKVSTADCEDIDDFIEPVKKKLQLATPPQFITLHVSEHSPPFESDDPLPAKNTKETALIVKVLEPVSTSSVLSVSSDGKLPPDSSHLKIDWDNDCHSFQVYENDLQELDPRQAHFSRVELINELAEFVENGNQSCFIICSPSATGKTSLLNLLADKLSRRYVIVYVSALKKADLTEALQKAGIEMETGIVKNRSRPLLILLDDAQEIYHDEAGWIYMLKNSILPKNGSKMIISAIHTLSLEYKTPIALQSMLRMKRDNLLLSRYQSLAFLSDSKIGLRNSLQHFNHLKEIIADDCGGVIGLLKFASLQLNMNVTSIQNDEPLAIKLFYDNNTTSQLDRCFGIKYDAQISKDLERVLVKFFTSTDFQQFSELSDFDKSFVYKLVKCGILGKKEKPGEIVDEVMFANTMARRYFLYRFFPNRARENPESVFE